MDKLICKTCSAGSLPPQTHSKSLVLHSRFLFEIKKSILEEAVDQGLFGEESCEETENAQDYERGQVTLTVGQVRPVGIEGDNDAAKPGLIHNCAFTSAELTV